MRTRTYANSERVAAAAVIVVPTMATFTVASVLTDPATATAATAVTLLVALSVVLGSVGASLTTPSIATAGISGVWGTLTAAILFALPTWPAWLPGEPHSLHVVTASVAAAMLIPWVGLGVGAAAAWTIRRR